MKMERGRHGKGEQANGMRQKVMLLLVPALAVTLWLLVREPMAPAPAAASETPEPNIALSDDAENIDWEIPPIYQPSGHDPMQLAPPTFLEADSAEPQTKVQVNLMLRGVLYSEDKPLAMIGTSLVQEGQQVSGATVIKIEKDSVEFEMDGRRWKQRVSDRALPSQQDKKQNRRRPARVVGEPQ